MASPDSVPVIVTIDEWFDEYVYKWMFNDLQAAINTGANYLAALGIAVYSEALMQFVYCGRGNSQKRFDAFLELLPEGYRKIDLQLKSLSKGDGLYNRVRCGLAHEYFVKKNASIYTKSSGEYPLGIKYDVAEDQLTIIVEPYFYDFKKAAENLHQRLKDKSLNEKGIGISGAVHYLTESGGNLPLKKDEWFLNDEGEVMKKKK